MRVGRQKGKGGWKGQTEESGMRLCVGVGLGKPQEIGFQQ